MPAERRSKLVFLTLALAVAVLLLLEGLPTVLEGIYSQRARAVAAWKNSETYYRWHGERLMADELEGVLIPPGESPVDNPSGEVLIIVLDTLRKDRVGVYGFDGGTTPRLDAWAEGARIFDNARAVSSWTLPTHASLFTGLLPSSHGAHGLAPEEKTWDGPQDAWALPSGTPTLAGIMASEGGYATVGISANRGYLTRPWGVSQGFQTWICRQIQASASHASPQAWQVVHLAEEVLERPRSRPVLLFLNFMDAHRPYEMHDEPDLLPPALASELFRGGGAWKRRRQEILAGRRALEAQERNLLLRGYDNQISYLDAQLGALLARLPRLGIDEEDLVVILSDHGEYFGEHDLVEHSKGLHEPVVAMPLLVKGREFAPGRDLTPIQTQDVPLAILSSLGLPPIEGAQPTSSQQVSELFWSRHADLNEPELQARFAGVHRAYISGGEKVLTRDGRCEEAYLLTEDPLELRSDVQADWAQQLCLRGEQAQAARPAVNGEPPLEEPTNIEMLEALGYL